MPPSSPAQVLLVGTFHFDSTDDAIQVEFDVRSERRQREIVEVVERLAEFRPTSLAVEAQPADMPRLLERYSSFLDDGHEPDGNEIEQLGFRLAARCGITELAPVDHRLELPFGSLLDWVEENDPDFARDFWTTVREREQLDNRLVAASTLCEALRHFNNPAVIARDHALYLGLAALGTPENPIGADLLSAWYERNVRIFASLLQLAKPGARIALLIGCGHLAILRELIRATPECDLVELPELLQAL